MRAGRGVAHQEDRGSLPPPSHFLTHHDADERCPACQDAKAKKIPAIQMSEEERKELMDKLRPLDVIDCDLCEMRIPGIYGNTWFMGTMDRKTLR